MTVEQHGFEPRGSIYIWILSIVNIIVLHDPLLVESTDAEPQIWKNYVYRVDYRLYADFPLYRESAPHVVQGSTVHLKEEYDYLIQYSFFLSISSFLFY